MAVEADQKRVLYASVSPHIRERTSIPRIMYAVVAALCPALFASVYFFGPRALWVVLIGMLSAVLTEALIQRLMKKPVTVSDGSALVTGMLLGFVSPPAVPLWMPMVGSAFAIAMGKQVFGGLGYNPMNPALLGRAFLLASWPVHMTARWSSPRGGTLSGIDTVTSTTPLAMLKEAHTALAASADKLKPLDVITQIPNTYGHLFWGRVGGCIGETSVFALLVGAAVLMYLRIIEWRIPASFIGTVALLSWALGGTDGVFTGDPLFHVLAGGLVLGAFFMATDMVTTPITHWGRVVFGVGCGVITVVIRVYGGYPEGVCYSILVMGAISPLIDAWTRPRIFGQTKKPRA